MGRLIYSALASLDGYVADAAGSFRWAAPDEEVHAFVNGLSRPIGTFLLGRRMYEVLGVWDTMDVADEPACIGEFQTIWKAADKIVYSRTLSAATTERTRVERDFDIGAVQRLKAEHPADLSIGGPEIAAQALRSGLVDELQLFLSPVVVGGGNAALPDDLALQLELVDERRFGNGTVFLRYAVGT